MKKTNTTPLVLDALWLDHIERFSERLRARLYAALISYLRHGIPVPEKYMPYLGIIVDHIAEAGIEVPEPPAAQPAETSGNEQIAQTHGSDLPTTEAVATAEAKSGDSCALTSAPEPTPPTRPATQCSHLRRKPLGCRPVESACSPGSD
ncbi:MAG: hypothetical protein K2M19_05550 [Muribaculaceae bacterium]|nr:hypothetical protein [Muribaculaceae bacterium]